jgi:hypothetical protein
MARRVSSQVVAGALIVLLGILLLFRTTDLYDVGGLFRFVPALFVLLGLYALVTSGFRNLVGPLLVVLVAGAWQLVALDYYTWEEVGDFWPVLVVVFGLSVLLGPLRGRGRSADRNHVTAFAVFGGSERRVTGAAFTGADLTALFGGATVDLRDVTVRDPPAHVSAFAAFGGVEIVAPPEWNVQVDVLPLFGGVDDERRRAEEPHEQVDLVVTGFVAFGGVSITD